MKIRSATEGSTPSRDEHLHAFREALLDVARYSRREPMIALILARRCVEAACMWLHNAHVGSANQRKLHEILSTLVGPWIPPEIGLLLGTVQAYGNFAAHPNQATSIAPNNATPAYAALANFAVWHFTALERPPPEIVEALASGVLVPLSRWLLVVEQGPLAGTRRIVPADRRVTWGRSSETWFVLPQEDRGISRTHVEVEYSLAGLFLHDLGSRNGTFVNEERVTRSRKLDDGDCLRLGRTVVRFLRVDGSELSTCPPVNPTPVTLAEETSLLPEPGSTPG